MYGPWARLPRFSEAVPCTLGYYLDSIPAFSMVKQFCVVKMFLLCILPQRRTWCALFCKYFCRAISLCAQGLERVSRIQVLPLTGWLRSFVSQVVGNDKWMWKVIQPRPCLPPVFDRKECFWKALISGVAWSIARICSPILPKFSF